MIPKKHWDGEIQGRDERVYFVHGIMPPLPAAIPPEQAERVIDASDVLTLFVKNIIKKLSAQTA